MVYMGKGKTQITILTHIPNAIAPFDQTAFIPGDMVYLGKRKTRSQSSPIS
ncbi:MAG: hypothetical protein RID09_25790 [Coleofasciculus sp. G1-WW12-02]|uniref:hypothetical protein n=1 Tax=Coleofasciculus sp. G1-WW12-02 TaxID=3068483 RepID=UPI0032F217B4